MPSRDHMFGMSLFLDSPVKVAELSFSAPKTEKEEITCAFRAFESGDHPPCPSSYYGTTDTTALVVEPFIKSKDSPKTSDFRIAPFRVGDIVSLAACRSGGVFRVIRTYCASGGGTKYQILHILENKKNGEIFERDVPAEELQLYEKDDWAGEFFRIMVGDVINVRGHGVAEFRFLDLTAHKGTRSCALVMASGGEVFLVDQRDVCHIPSQPAKIDTCVWFNEAATCFEKSIKSDVIYPINKK